MGPSFDDDDDPLDDGVSAEEADLRDLESRLDRLKPPAHVGNALYARGVALVTSMGFVLAGCLAAGFFLGQAVANKTGQPIFTALGTVAGLAAALFAVAKLMAPFLKSSE